MHVSQMARHFRNLRHMPKQLASSSRLKHTSVCVCVCVNMQRETVPLCRRRASSQCVNFQTRMTWTKSSSRQKGQWSIIQDGQVPKLLTLSQALPNPCLNARLRNLGGPFMYSHYLGSQKRHKIMHRTSCTLLELFGHAVASLACKWLSGNDALKQMSCFGI